MLEVWQNVGQWSPGIAFGMACLWFFNFIVTKFLEEKSEWNARQESMLNRYDGRLVDITTALVNAANQDHQLRGKIQEIMTDIQTQLREINNALRDVANRTRGGADD